MSQGLPSHMWGQDLQTCHCDGMAKYHGYIQINHSKTEPNHKWLGGCIILKYDFLGLPHHSLSSFRHCTCCNSCVSFFSSDRRLCGSLVHQCWMIVVPGRIVNSFPRYCRLCCSHSHGNQTWLAGTMFH